MNACLFILQIYTMCFLIFIFNFKLSWYFVSFFSPGTLWISASLLNGPPWLNKNYLLTYFGKEDSNQMHNVFLKFYGNFFHSVNVTQLLQDETSKCLGFNFKPFLNNNNKLNSLHHKKIELVVIKPFLNNNNKLNSLHHKIIE